MQLNTNNEIICSHLGKSYLLKFLTNIYDELKSAQVYYPEFEKWYFNKVVPNILNAQREIICLTRNNKIASISIIKNTPEEKKLCTLRVISDFQNRGIGIKAFEASFDTLGTDKPFLTVSEEKLPEFQRVFDYYGFKLTSIHNNLYRKDKKEYFFNEL